MTISESFLNGASATVGVISVLIVYFLIEKCLYSRTYKKKNVGPLNLTGDIRLLKEEDENKVIDYFNDIKEILQKIEKNTNPSPNPNYPNLE